MTKQACGIACLVAAVGSWTAARADDAAAEGPCAVEIARAPDDARAAIARWVAEEPRCGAPLTVRVVPTAEGLYVLAQAADGRAFERVVPDAEAAGVLVASWAARAEDRAPAAALRAPATPAGAAIDVAGEPADAGPASSPAGDVWRRRWVEVAAVAREDDAVGATVTGRYALSRGGRWSVGLAGAVAMLSVPMMGPTGMTDRVSLGEASAALQGAWTLRLAPWRLRAELDLGIAGMGRDAWSASAQVHAAVEIGRPVSGRWGVFARGESLTRARRLGDTLQYAASFDEGTHWLGLAVGVATPL